MLLHSKDLRKLLAQKQDRKDLVNLTEDQRYLAEEEGGAGVGIYLADQTITFLQAILLGGVLGLLYDFFRISRIAFITADSVIAAEDILYWGLCAVCTFFFLMSTIDGHVRAFLLIGECIGWILYRGTLSVAVMGISQSIINFIKGLIRLVIRLIFQPIRRFLFFVWRIFSTPVVNLWRNVHKIALKAKFSLKVRRLLLYNQFTGPRARSKREEHRADGTNKTL